MDCHISDQLFHPKQNIINICLKVSEKYQVTDYLGVKFLERRKPKEVSPYFWYATPLHAFLPQMDRKEIHPAAQAGKSASF